MEHQVRTGLTVGITPRQIKGIIIELLFYLGFPATAFGLRVAQEVIDEREEWKADDLPLDVEWLDSIDEMLRQGRTRLVNNWGERASAEMENSLARRLVPEVAELVDAYHYGQVWARDDLNPKERTVCILGGPHVPGALAAVKASRRLRPGRWPVLPRKFAKCLSRPVGTGAGPTSRTRWKQAYEVFTERGV